jgi:hypothetical protein
VRRLETNYSTLVWSPDGTRVTKSRPPGDYPTRRYRNERRVNTLLDRYPPPVPTPRLLAADRRTRSLTFEAIPGEPLGPKYPTDLSTEAIDTMLAFARALRPFNPRPRRWFRRLQTERRLESAACLGLVETDAVDDLVALARRHHRKLRFAHGDLVVRNALRHGDDVALIDWEWAGLHPPGYDEAFLWFSLQDVAGGRAHVEHAATVDETSFLLSALVIELWHLRWYVTDAFRPVHLETRDDLVGRLLG